MAFLNASTDCNWTTDSLTVSAGRVGLGKILLGIMGLGKWVGTAVIRSSLYLNYCIRMPIDFGTNSVMA